MVANGGRSMYVCVCLANKIYFLRINLHFVTYGQSSLPFMCLKLNLGIVVSFLKLVISIPHALVISSHPVIQSPHYYIYAALAHSQNIITLFECFVCFELCFNFSIHLPF